PPDCHLLLRRGHIRVVKGPREHGSRPAIDPLFRSAAAAYGPQVVGVVLSGMMDDGGIGLAAIGRSGGVRVVQDPEARTFASRPLNALRMAGADHVVAAVEMPPLLMGLTQEEVPALNGSEQPLDPVEFTPEESERAAQRGVLTQLTCPECNGVLWE